MNKTINSYNQLADTYEQRWDAYLAHTHQRFLHKLKTDADDIILDVSCGTGLLAKHLVDQNFPFRKLILNDVSSKMQEKAKQRLTDHPDIYFTQQNALELSLDNEEVNKMLCLSAFHNYKHQQQTLKRLYDVLQPGGQLFLLDWNNSGWFRPINWVIKKWVPEIINTKSLQETEALLRHVGFKTTRTKEWRFRYWKLFFVTAEKI